MHDISTESIIDVDTKNRLENVVVAQKIRGSNHGKCSVPHTCLWEGIREYSLIRKPRINYFRLLTTHFWYEAAIVVAFLLER